jgi:hypothetical protein
MKLDDSCITKQLTADFLFLLASFFISIRISTLPSSDNSSNAPGTAATHAVRVAAVSSRHSPDVVRLTKHYRPEQTDN